MKTFNPITISCFKAYDVRGELDVNLDSVIVYRIGRAFAQYLNHGQKNHGQKNSVIVVGADIRSSSNSLKQSVIDGITDAGVDVIDLGMVGTEEVYFATSHYNAIGGIEVTASHNPINYNGLKMVRENSRPISADTGLADIRTIADQASITCAIDDTYSIGKNDVVIDIRATDESDDDPLDVPHICIPFYKLATEFDTLDESKTYLLYCKKGVMSGLQAVYLKDKGHDNVKVLRRVHPL